MSQNLRGICFWLTLYTHQGHTQVYTRNVSSRAKTNHHTQYLMLSAEHCTSMQGLHRQPIASNIHIIVIFI